MIATKINQALDIIQELASFIFRASLSLVIYVLVTSWTHKDLWVMLVGLITWTVLPYIRFFLNQMGWLYENA